MYSFLPNTQRSEPVCLTNVLTFSEVNLLKGYSIPKDLNVGKLSTFLTLPKYPLTSFIPSNPSLQWASHSHIHNLRLLGTQKDPEELMIWDSFVHADTSWVLHYITSSIRNIKYKHSNLLAQLCNPSESGRRKNSTQQ